MKYPLLLATIISSACASDSNMPSSQQWKVVPQLTISTEGKDAVLIVTRLREVRGINGDPSQFEHTYGIEITNGQDSFYLLYSNKWSSPFPLKSGDKFHIDLSKYPYDKELNGYWVPEGDIRKANSSS